MKPVMQYMDYRKFLRDFYAERKPSGFTFREFSRLAGYSSPVFLKLVMDGKANLSEAGTERVALASGLVGSDAAYFRTLVAMNQCRDEAQKKPLFKRLREIAKANKVKLVGEDQYDYYESWLSPTLREMLPQLPNSKVSEISKRLLFKSPTPDIRKAVRILLDTGLLQKGPEGRLEQTDKRISTGDLETPSPAIREMHRQMGRLGVEALETVPVEDRDVSGLTIGIPEDALPRIRAEIAAFRRRISNIATESAKTERVYRLNVQFFPLTKHLAGEGGAK